MKLVLETSVWKKPLGLGRGSSPISVAPPFSDWVYPEWVRSSLPRIDEAVRTARDGANHLKHHGFLL
jgi:hypothetical protein